MQIRAIPDRFSAVSGRIPVFASANRPPPVNLTLPSGSWTSSVTPKALQMFNPSIRAESAADNVIQILGTIGEDYWSNEAVTVKSVSDRLAAIGSGDVEVHINSPGGDVFQGVGIYNVLRQYAGKVTVKVLGMAASAASIIAMAGDEILMGQSTFLMIHNAWVYGAGNKEEFRRLADYLEPFDAALCDVYVTRSSQPADSITAMMDAETWLDASKSIALGFATGTMTDPLAKVDGAAATKASSLAARKIEAALMQNNGCSRSEARALIKALKAGTQDAADQNAGTPDAAEPTPPEKPLDLSPIQLAIARLSLSSHLV